MTLEILFEDKDIVAVDKPAGVLVHEDGVSEGPFVTEWVRERYPQTEGVGETFVLRDGREIRRPGIVHRLDGDTSGVLLIAKTEEGFGCLKEQFKERAVVKTYNAFVYGNIKEDEGVIDRPIGKSRKNFRAWSAQRGARGKLREAKTEYKVLMQGKTHLEARLPSEGVAVSFLEVYPRTGRTHQIRVHLKAIHHPVVCDSLYAPNHPCILGFTRLALHARSIEFLNTQGERVRAESPLPEDFMKAQENIVDGGLNR